MSLREVVVVCSIVQTTLFSDNSAWPCSAPLKYLFCARRVIWSKLVCCKQQSRGTAPGAMTAMHSFDVYVTLLS